ncbi:recombination directionality factor [Microbispora bryophytorum]|uniref:recombination directionality factor n=1 Tax=Microbispora bryophytorum TaxID=1460882 RepID=UPI003410B8F0
MPIDPSVLQRRHWQDGRIRLGVKKTSQSGSQYPSKIETFRFTSPSEEMIRGVAEKYGGQVRPWASPDGPQWEVITSATRIPVIVPPNGLSQNMELWESKLCVRRCSGVAMQPPFVGPCLCGATTPIDQRPCKPHTRLGVFLKEVPSLGLWRLDSKGGNAAAELPNAAEFLAHAGTYVDAWLYLSKRTGTMIDPRTKQPKPTTYMVPGLTIEGIGFDELMSGEVARRAELGRAGGQKALEAAPATDYLAMIEQAATRDDVLAIWQTVKLDPAWHGRAQEVEEAAKARVGAIAKQTGGAAPQGQPAPAAQQQTPPAAPPAPAAAPTPPPPAATTPAEGDPEAVRLRHQIMTAWPGTVTDLHREFQAATGTTMKNATVEQLEGFAKVGPIMNQMGDQPPAPPASAPAADIVDADVVGEEPAATKGQLRELGIWMGEAGVTSNTGKGAGEKNDEARFAWIREHLGVTVTSTEQLSGPKVKEAIDLLIQQAATRRKDLQQRIVNVWADLGGTNEQLSAVFQQVTNTSVQQAKTSHYAAFLKKLTDGKVTPDNAAAGGE